MCELLNEPVRNGTNKDKWIKEVLNKYITYNTDGRKFTNIKLKEETFILNFLNQSKEEEKEKIQKQKIQYKINYVKKQKWFYSKIADSNRDRLDKRGVYVFINGKKVYVGSTTTSFFERFYSHLTANTDGVQILHSPRKLFKLLFKNSIYKSRWIR